MHSMMARSLLLLHTLLFKIESGATSLLCPQDDPPKSPAALITAEDTPDFVFVLCFVLFCFVFAYSQLYTAVLFLFCPFHNSTCT